MSFLESLNPQQREAVTHAGSPLLILAGAGSGKTRVITCRIAHLLRHQGVGAHRVLAVTFTNKAAGEMKDRVTQLVSGDLRSLWVSTFHSACVRILRRDGPAAGIPKDFTIYDDDAQLALIKRILKELGLTMLDEPGLAPRAVLSKISHHKNHGRTPLHVYQSAKDAREERVASVYEHYQQGLVRNKALDFDDLLLETVRLLRSAEDVRRKYNERFQHLLVDEYQDTNRVQYELIRLLTEAHSNLCVVGDEDQSIYSFRGADIRNILEFEADYPAARLIRLEQNYRSTKTVLAAAGAVVAHNLDRKGKTLWTERERGALVAFYEAADAEQEALWIAEQIHNLGQAKRIAVLYRTNAQSRLMEEALRRYRLKYHVVGGFSFYERAEIKDLIAYLKVAQNPDDSISLSRIVNTPPRGIGKGTLEQLEVQALENNRSLWGAITEVLERRSLPPRALSALAEFRTLVDDLAALAAAEAPIADLLKAVFERTRYVSVLEEEGTPEGAARVENVQELLNAAADADTRADTLTDFLDQAALTAEADDLDERARITLLTLHSAKGLEFSVVFLAGMEEGVFPHARSLADRAAIEEERRLCYVGMTRAQDRLFLTRARERRRFGEMVPDESEPSRFLDEIPLEHVEDLTPRRKARHAWSEAGGAVNSADNIQAFFAKRGIELPPRKATPPLVPAAPARPAATELKAGERVKHPKWGVGTVLRREGDGADAKLTVSFPGYGLKKLVARFAVLERD
jgi:DNA helicase-2/ATP-dependent DNA helicase PcrA